MKMDHNGNKSAEKVTFGTPFKRPESRFRVRPDSGFGAGIVDQVGDIEPEITFKDDRLAGVFCNLLNRVADDQAARVEGKALEVALREQRLRARITLLSEGEISAEVHGDSVVVYVKGEPHMILGINQVRDLIRLVTNAARDRWGYGAV